MSNPGLGITRIRYNGCNLSQLWSLLYNIDAYRNPPHQHPLMVQI